jgi:hypothetical protein
VNASGAISGATLLGTGLTSGDCVQASTGGLLTTTGAACASGGVTSITPGSSGNLSFTPSTGAVVGDITESPNFTGLALFGTVGGSDSTGIGIGANVPSGRTYLLGGTAGDVLNGITGYALVASNSSGLQFAMDATGNFSIANNFYSTGLSASVGQGLAIGTNGEIVPNGTPSVQQLHGHQSITAVAAACTPGTPIVFAHTFSAVPDIIMSTSAVVGDTAAPETGTITTTGFTPELCSVASAAAATVYWQAVN